MIPPIEIILGFVLPAMISAIVLIIAWQPFRSNPPAHKWGGPVAIGLAYCAGIFGLIRLLPNPNRDVNEVVFYVAAGAMILGFLDSILNIKLWIRLPLIFLAAAAADYFLLQPVQPGDWSTRDFYTHIAIFAAATFVWWMVLEMLAGRIGGPFVPIVLTILIGATSAVVIMSNSQKLGQFGGVLTAAVLGNIPIAWWTGSKSHLCRGAILPVSILFSLLLLGSHFTAYNGITSTRAILLFASPILIWVREFPFVRSCSPFKRNAVAIIAMLIPMGFVIVTTAIEFKKGMAELGY